jgi:hypothetical protein
VTTGRNRGWPHGLRSQVTPFPPQIPDLQEQIRDRETP